MPLWFVPLDAGTVGPSPLKLEAWSFKPAQKTKQFADSQVQFTWFSAAEKAMDGWSREELCRGNDLLGVIEDL